MTSEPRLVRVLCVDDYRDVADSLARMLTMHGYETATCYDGPSALAVAEAFDPDVCLIDLHMPGMAGDEVAVRLRDRLRGRDPLLVAITAMSDDAALARTAGAGFHAHLVKPVDPARLLSLLARFDDPGRN